MQGYIKPTRPTVKEMYRLFGAERCNSVPKMPQLNTKLRFERRWMQSANLSNRNAVL